MVIPTTVHVQSELQQYLRSNGTLDGLWEGYRIVSTRHPEYPNLVQFVYTKGSDLSKQICREARGIILDEADSWNIMARGFDKFFEHDSPLAASLNWKQVKAYEKMDGTCMLVWWYRDKWNVSTITSPDASAQIGLTNTAFSELFWRLANMRNIVSVLDECTDLRHYTLIFEMVSLLNRVVARYGSPDLYLLGGRHRHSSAEYGASFLNSVVKTQLNLDGDAFTAPRRLPGEIDLALLERNAAYANPLRFEGYVAVDNNYNRVKVKTPGYEKLHLIRSVVNPDTMLKSMIETDLEDMRSLVSTLDFIQLREEIDVLYDRYLYKVVRAEDEYDRSPKRKTYGTLDEQESKEYREWVAKYSTFPPYMYARRFGDGVYGIRPFVREVLSIEYVRKVLSSNVPRLAPDAATGKQQRDRAAIRYKQEREELGEPVDGDVVEVRPETGISGGTAARQQASH